MGRFSQFAIAASKMALDDAKLDINESNATRVGVIIGSGIGALEVIETEIGKMIEKGPKRISPSIFRQLLQIWRQEMYRYIQEQKDLIRQ